MGGVCPTTIKKQTNNTVEITHTYLSFLSVQKFDVERMTYPFVC